MRGQENNILLFTSEYPPHIGGVARYYRDMVAAWNQTHEQGIAVLATTLKPHWLFDIVRLWRAVRRQGSTTVLAGQLLPVGTVTWLVGTCLRFDYVVFVHGMDLPYALKSARKRWLAQRILRNATHIIAVNSYVRTMLADAIAGIEQKIAVVNPGVSENLQNADFGLQHELKKRFGLEHKTVLLQVGRLVERKGVDTVLEALPTAVERCPDLVYVVVGNGPEKDKLQAMSKPLQKEGSVLFIDNATDEEVNAWYDVCDIFIMPSRHIGNDFEGFGIVYLEANAHGKPVIAGDSGGVRDAVVDGVNGLLVDPEDTDTIAQAIVKLCRNQELRKALGEQGRERVKEFAWERQVQKLHTMLGSV